MKKFTPFLLLTVLAGAALAPATPAFARDLSLANLASVDRLGYSVVSATDEVLLQATGLTIAVRPGERMMEVNGVGETLDVAPHFYQHYVYVSPKTAARIAQLAAAHVPARGAYHGSRIGGTGETPVGYRGVGSAPALAAGPVTLVASQSYGSPNLNVNGTAPAGIPLTLTLRESITKEVPDVVVATKDVRADADGKFSTSMSVAPAFAGGALLKVTAVTAAGAEQTSNAVVLKRFNENTDIPMDRLPKGVR